MTMSALKAILKSPVLDGSETFMVLIVKCIYQFIYIFLEEFNSNAIYIFIDLRSD